MSERKNPERKKPLGYDKRYTLVYNDDVPEPFYEYTEKFSNKISKGNKRALRQEKKDVEYDSDGDIKLFEIVDDFEQNDSLKQKVSSYTIDDYGSDEFWNEGPVSEVVSPEPESEPVLFEEPKKTYNKIKGELPYQTWKRVTGTDWSNAHKLGYTTGRDQENLQLQKDLLSGNINVTKGNLVSAKDSRYVNSKMGIGSYYLNKPKKETNQNTENQVKEKNQEPHYEWGPIYKNTPQSATVNANYFPSAKNIPSAKVNTNIPKRANKASSEKEGSILRYSKPGKKLLAIPENIWGNIKRLFGHGTANDSVKKQSNTTQQQRKQASNQNLQQKSNQNLQQESDSNKFYKTFGSTKISLSAYNGELGIISKKNTDDLNKKISENYFDKAKDGVNKIDPNDYKHRTWGQIVAKSFIDDLEIGTPDMNDKKMAFIPTVDNEPDKNYFSKVCTYGKYMVWVAFKKDGGGSREYFVKTKIK